MYIRIAREINVPIYFKYGDSGEVIDLADGSAEEHLRYTISKCIKEYPGTQVNVAKLSGQCKTIISELRNRSHNNRQGLLAVMTAFKAFGSPLYFVTDPSVSLNP